MAYPPALTESELHRLNLRSIRDWIESNKGKIKAKPNNAVFYSGRDYDLEVNDKISLEDRKEFKGTRMYLLLEQTKKQMKELKIPCDFQTLEDVLKSLRDHPKLLSRDRQERRFSNAFEFFQELAEAGKLLPDTKAVVRASWDRLSEIYASNAVGDIRILDGAADDYGKLRDDKILIRTELGTLLKNKNLSPAGKVYLQKKITKYGESFDQRYTKLIQLLTDEKKRLKRR